MAKCTKFILFFFITKFCFTLLFGSSKNCMYVSVIFMVSLHIQRDIFHVSWFSSCSIPSHLTLLYSCKFFWNTKQKIGSILTTLSTALISLENIRQTLMTKLCLPGWEKFYRLGFFFCFVYMLLQTGRVFQIY